MNIVKKWILGNEETAGRNGALWNMIASILYSLQSAILLLVITRATGLVDGGIFTIAYTVTQMMATIGSFGMREFQASDAKQEYKFETYFSSRIVSVLAMVVICMGYSVIRGYTGEKLILIAILCLYRLIEDVEDVIHGEMQRSLRFDIAAKIMTTRIFTATVLFIVAYIIFKNLTVACATLTVSAALVSICFNSQAIKLFATIKLKLIKEKLIKLLWVCLPICVGGFLYNYLVNAPKYAIDRNLSEETQSIFNILFMPIFAINMFSMFVFKPMVAKMGVVWTNGESGKFLKMVLKQTAVIVGITVALMGLGAAVGTQVLGLIYGVELVQYRLFFTLLIMFGGFAAFVAFYVVVLTIMRKQMFVVVAYLAGTVIELLLVDKVVIAKGLDGAGIMYGVGILAVLVVLLLVFVISILMAKKRHDKGVTKVGLDI